MSKKYLDEVRNCYNLAANEYSRTYINELDQKPFDRNIIDRFSDLLDSQSLIFDFGCGSGQTTNYIHKKNKHKVLGLDFSENSINLARQTLPEIQFEIDDMLNSKMGTTTANGIIAFYAIVHFDYEDIKRVMQEWYRLLKDNGYCLFSFHIGEEFVEVQDFLDIKGANATWHLLDTDKVLGIAEEAGFKIMETIIRYPYKGVEHESKRAYIMLKKEDSSLKSL